MDQLTARIEAHGEDERQVAVVYLEGNLTTSTLPVLQAEVESLREWGEKRFVIEMGRIDYIDSGAIGYLIGLHEDLVRVKGNLRFAGVLPRISRILKFAGLGRRILIAPTVNEAVESFDYTEKSLDEILDEARKNRRL